MNELQVFKNPEFGEIRTIEENGKVLFCGTDVAKSLGYSNPRDAISRYCRYVVKCDVPHPQAPDKMIEMLFVPEGDVYRLIAHSKLPGAEKFETWLFDEVAPSVVIHGAYMTPDTLDRIIASPEFGIKLLTALQEERAKGKALEAKIQAGKPLVLFANSVAASNTSILIGDLAKLIRQNGVDMGQNRLFIWLRDNQYLCAKGERYNMPTQRSMELGLFEVKETTIANPDGSIRVTKTTKVTGKGQQYFINRFLGRTT